MTQYLKCYCNTKNVQWPSKRMLAAEKYMMYVSLFVAVKIIKTNLLQIPNNTLGAISYIGNFKTVSQR